MPHPLVTQLWFTRREFVRCLEGVTPQDALKQIGSMNCLSWIVGHLASQEQYLWLESAQGVSLFPDLHDTVGYGSPASTPPWEEMWEKWRLITGTSDKFLVLVTDEIAHSKFARKNNMSQEDVGKSILRNIYHYWFHLGEAHAIRQALGHEHLPQFVGDLSEVQY